MSRNRNALAFVALLAMLAFITVGCASATTYTVCHSGCDYSNIQAAINAAESGDTLEVHSGTYYENVDVTKQLILKGVDTGSGKPVIDAGGIGSAITLSADEITLEGFTITNSGSRFEAGIKVTSNNNAISGNNASNNNHNGIKICESGNNTITGNIVSNNGVDGIQLIGSSNNNITGNAATNNHYGLFFSGSCGNSLRDNQMSDNCNNFKVISDSYYHFINDIDTKRPEPLKQRLWYFFLQYQ
jgi:parallel beta-helix repeat protein